MQCFQRRLGGSQNRVVAHIRLQFLGKRIIRRPCRANRILTVQRNRTDSRDHFHNAVDAVGILGALPRQQRITAVHQRVGVPLEAVPQQGKERIRPHLLRRPGGRGILSAGHAADCLTGVVVAPGNLVAGCHKACNTPRAVQDIHSGHSDLTGIVAVPDFVSCLHSAGNAAGVVICRHDTHIVARGNRNVYGGSVAPRRQMPDDTADCAVPGSHGADVIAAADDAVTAVPHRSDDTAAPAAAPNVRTVPAVDKVRTVAPSGNGANEGPVVRADFTARHTDIPNDGVTADVAEQPACIRIQVVQSISLSVKNAVKLLGGRSADRHPVGILTQVKVPGQKENIAREGRAGVHAVGKRLEFCRSADAVRIVRRPGSLPRHFFPYLNGKRGLEHSVQDVYGAILKAQLARDGQPIVIQFLAVSVIVHCLHHQSGRIKGLPGKVARPVRHLRHGDGSDVGSIRIQRRLPADQRNGGRQRGVIPHVAPLCLRHCTEQRQCLLQLRLIVSRRGIIRRLDGSHRRPAGIRRVSRVRPHIVQGTHPVFESPVGNQRIGSLIVCHGVPATVHNMAEAAVRQPEAQHPVQQSLAVAGDEARILGRINADCAERHHDLRNALHIVRVP